MKKGLLIFGAVAIAIAVVPLFAAFEAHIINVTAHIENALSVDATPIDFGTVFPQEYIDDENITIALSDSFLDADRVDDVEYVIKQKPKCKRTELCPPVGVDPDCSLYVPVDRTTHECPAGYAEMLSLCPYLSKTNDESDGTETENDTSHRSYFQGQSCLTTPDPDATGRLSKIAGDTSDLWTIDLKVPPVEGTVGQDWPAGCPTVAENNQDYGCDLWIEVTEISEAEPQT